MGQENSVAPSGGVPDLARLFAPFDENDLTWRVMRSGLSSGGKPWAQIVPYLQSRAVMDRLDAVVGPGNWEDHYDPIAGGFLCTLSIRVGDEWVRKMDGASSTDIEPVKGGISDALKRAAVKWGVGRYLYAMGSTWAEDIHEGYLPDGKNGVAIRIKDHPKTYWAPVPTMGRVAVDPPETSPPASSGSATSSEAKSSGGNTRVVALVKLKRMIDENEQIVDGHPAGPTLRRDFSSFDLETLNATIAWLEKLIQEAG